jgi:hypothetical protein
MEINNRDGPPILTSSAICPERPPPVNMHLKDLQVLLPGRQGTLGTPIPTAGTFRTSLPMTLCLNLRGAAY